MGEKNTTGLDTILDCHNCAHSQAGTMIPTGGFILVCSITERPAMERCGKFDYQYFSEVAQ